MIFGKQNPSPETYYEQGVIDGQRNLQNINYSNAEPDNPLADVLDRTLDFSSELRDLELSLRGQAEAFIDGRWQIVQVTAPMMNEQGIRTMLDIVRLRTRTAILTDIESSVANKHTAKTAMEVYFAIAENMTRWNVDQSRRSVAAWNVIETVDLMLKRGIQGEERLHIYKRTSASEVYHKSDTNLNQSKKGFLGLFG